MKEEPIQNITIYALKEAALWSRISRWWKFSSEINIFYPENSITQTLSLTSIATAIEFYWSEK